MSAPNHVRRPVAARARGGSLAAVLVLAFAATDAAAQEGELSPDEPLDETWAQVLGLDPVAGEVAAESAREDVEERYDVGPAVQPDERGAGWHVDLRVQGRQWARTGLEGSAGEVERRSYGLGVSAATRRGANLWSLDYLLESHDYRFGAADGLLPGTDAPIESLISHQLTLVHRRPLGEHLRGTFVAGVEVAMEEGAAIGDALTWRALGLVGWPVREGFEVDLGLFVRDRLEDDALLVPALGIDWTIGRSTSLRLYGPNAELSYRYDDGAEVYLRGDYNNDQFRLDDSGPNPDGSFADSGFTVIAGVRFDAGIGEGVLATSSFEIYAGASLARELEFRIGDVEVGGADVDDGAIFGLNYTFGL